MQAVRTKVIDIQNWTDFEGQIRGLQNRRDVLKAENKRRFKELLFRGLGNSDWGLETTLERSFPLDRSDMTLSLLAYYRKILTVRPAVATLTEQRWFDIPDYPKFAKLLKSSKSRWLDRILGDHVGVYRFMIYLRHHHFPSPLLDWTASPYVAALFAFDSMPANATHVCVYAFLQDTITTFDSKGHMFVVGPYIEAHRRHFLQQSRYSMCVAANGNDYSFLPHETTMGGAHYKNGELFKIRIPASERTSALAHLDLMNINAYSVLGSEESLIRSIARRECLFKSWEV